MFEQLSERLEGLFKNLRGKGKLGPGDVDEALREVRLALLEADVHFRAVKHFTTHVRERAVGERVLSSLTPAQAVIGVVREELAAILGGQAVDLPFAKGRPTVWMLVGLQGAGKTSMAQKLALMTKEKGRSPHLVACDLQRPAAMEQLQVLGDQIDVPVTVSASAKDPVEVARRGIEAAEAARHDVVIVDTAGRTEQSEALMAELSRMRSEIKPDMVLFVADAMTGQSAVTVGEGFKRAVGIDGIALTKMDGDARGGAALSLRFVLGVPIFVLGVGEKAKNLEVFHPDRMAQRILGMGDVLSLIERAKETVDEEEAKAMQKKLRQADISLEDFLKQLKAMRKMGPMSELMGMIPGMGALKKKGVDVKEDELTRVEAIILSMTPEERLTPAMINGSRRRRIARGSGTTIAEVNRLLKQFDSLKKMLKGMKGSRGKKLLQSFPPLERR